ncbi:MAG: hypothetical protein M3Y21_10300 [Candidatus Eremiobacteraeota bacterium]|nr:hypothetical protein [Candidatus Eremiobacteraeota bacterium]
MEHFFIHLAQSAAWFFLIVFVFAVIGVIAVIRWIIALVTGTERAVTTGVHNVEGRITHRDQ